MSTSTKSNKKFHEAPAAFLLLMAKLRAFVANRERAAVRAASLALVICPVIVFYLFDLYTHNPFVEMKPRIQLLNILFYELTAFLLVGLLGRVRTALMVQSGFFMIAGIANYYVMRFRSTPIMPWDIFSLSTAASVADNFDYTPEADAVLVTLGFVILLLLESRICRRTASGSAVIKQKVLEKQGFGSVVRKAGGRLLLIGASAILLCAYTGMVQNDSFIIRFGLYDKLFTPSVINKRDGNAVAFLMELEYLIVEKPEGYTRSGTEAFLQEQAGQALSQAKEAPESVNRPNIIVIMDEAFSDLSVLGELETNEDYMPFIHSLKQDWNTEVGWLNVSVLGGNTANTEFEFLTGHSMAFLPQGSVAYQQYVKTPEPSLASYLKELGYSTVAMHPYYADGWERDRVYPLMGFDSFLSRDDFEGAKKLRKYISDEACFEKIVELYEQKEEGQPLFVFHVTMQNHSGYDETFANFTPDITVDGVQSRVLSQYLSLIHRTDQAFEELIAYFERQKEDTVIVFFGDHQPTAFVSNPVLRSNGIDPESLSFEENLLKYKVPYVIWSNFEPQGTASDSEDMKRGETSANYLAIDVLERCGLPLPEYQNYLKALREDYPVITANQIRDAQGELCMDGYQTQEEQEKAAEAILPYQRLQYYLLFDQSVR